MKINELMEARRNPDHPSQRMNRKPDGSRKQIIDVLRDYTKTEEPYYVSFQTVPKLGHNPKSQYGGTPDGIFGYPLYDLDLYSMKDFEYGSDRGYIFVFKMKSGSKVLNLNDYTKKDLTVDFPKLEQLWRKYVGDEISLSDAYNNLSEDDPRLNKFDETMTGRPLHKSAFDRLYFSAYLIAYHFTEGKDNSYEKGGFKSFNKYWSKVIMALGYDAILDDSNDFQLHHAEQNQICVFKQSSLEVVEFIDRSKESDTYIDKDAIGRISPDWRQFISEYNRTPQSKRGEFLVNYSIIGNGYKHQTQYYKMLNREKMQVLVDAIRYCLKNDYTWWIISLPRDLMDIILQNMTDDQISDMMKIHEVNRMLLDRHKSTIIKRLGKQNENN